ncbi:MAG: substrate-binding domain-containing protein [bacterium]|nr:substrate-binding domain-containing protein [bacterium]
MALRICGFILLVSLLSGCANNSGSQAPKDTVSTGEITVACDESLKPIMEAEKMVFEGLYTNAKINMLFMSEFEAVQYLLKDSARLAIITRELKPDELAVLKEQKISKARYHKIGYDAIAFIMHATNKDTSLSLNQVKGLMSGELHNWNQINPNNNFGEIQIVFDNPTSGAIRLLQDSVLKGLPLGKNCFALKGNEAVLEYVEKNKNAIGIIGVSWISDTDDLNARQFLDNIKVAEVEPILMRVAGINNKPMQGNIALKQYPYYRLIKVVSREMREGLGTGFASFMESEPGQKIILKGGLVPYRSSIRTINLK